MDMISRFAFWPKMTLVRWRTLTARGESAEALWNKPAAFFSSAQWSDEIVADFVTWRAKFDEVKMVAILAREGIRVITIEDVDYPGLLKEIYDPPFALFVRGTLSLGSSAIGVVGTRAMTVYGKQVTGEIVGPLARAGCTIVSGLALGIDGEAHRTTLAHSGVTIAVLGTGNDAAHVYPAAHRQLANDIVAHGGAVISEYPPGSSATAYSFPARNRIIAGLTRGTLVIEAGESSGALITASCALDNGREVFTIPQNITSPTSIGPNHLLKNGAKLVTSADDIFEVFGVVAPSAASERQEIPASVTATERTILLLLSRTPLHVDALIVSSALAGPIVMSTLTLLEIKGLVKNMGSMMYIRSL